MNTPDTKEIFQLYRMKAAMPWELEPLVAAIEIKRDEAMTELKHLADLLDAHFERGGTVEGIGTTNKARQILARTNVKTEARKNHID